MNEQDWERLIYSIKQKNCILMLGPGASVVENSTGQFKPLITLLIEELIGKEELKQVEQQNLHQAVQHYLLNPDKDKSLLECNVCKFFDSWQNNTTPLHKLLAELPFSVIVTLTADNLILNALKQCNKTPLEYIYNYYGGIKEELNLNGTVESPLVLYLCGNIKKPESLVLTDTDLLNFLIAVISNNPPIPASILKELRDKRKSYLFVGFGFTHWYLRILLHLLEKDIKRDRFSFAFEASAPAQDTVLFYKHDYHIQIYSMAVSDFINELTQRYKKMAKTDSIAPSPDAPEIFICHANEDKDKAARLYKQLQEAGFRPWLDKQNLRGGDRWDNVIEKTIKEVDYFVVLQSNALIQKDIGYVNKEMRLALKRQDLFRLGTNFIIPVRIEQDCQYLDELSEFQTIDLFQKGGFDNLVSAIKRDYQRRNKR